MFHIKEKLLTLLWSDEAVTCTLDLRNVAFSFNTPSQKVNRKGKLSLIEK